MSTKDQERNTFRRVESLGGGIEMPKDYQLNTGPGSTTDDPLNDMPPDPTFRPTNEGHVWELL